MGKERLIGLTVVVVLLGVFSGVLYQRVMRAKSDAAVATADGKPSGKSPGASKSKGDLFGISGKLPTGTAATTDKTTNEIAHDNHAGDAAQTEVAPPVSRYPSARTTAPPNAGFMPQEEAALTEDDADEQVEKKGATANKATAEASPTANDRYGDRNRSATMPDDKATTEKASDDGAVADTGAATAQAAPAFDDVTKAEDAQLDDDARAGKVATDNRTEALAAETPQTVSNPFTRSTAPTGITPSVAETSAGDLADNDAELAATKPASARPPARLDNRAVAASALVPATTAGSAAMGASDSRGRFGHGASRTSHATAIQEGGTYKLGLNENYWTVSELAYGTSGYFKALAAYNEERFPNPEDLRYGDEIAVPLRTELEKLFPQLCPKPGRRSAAQNVSAAATPSAPDDRIYVVEEGDTLFDIARYELGKAARWAELYELNRDVIGDDLDFLAPGTKLVLPELDPRESLTRQPENNLQ